MNNQFSLKQEQSLPCNSRSGVYSKHFYKGQYREDGGIGRLDCHGLSHKAALRKIERGISRLLFYRTTECFEVITGNSPKMREVLFDLCDEMGILVWQDFMFACSVYNSPLAFSICFSGSTDIFFRIHGNFFPDPRKGK